MTAPEPTMLRRVADVPQRVFLGVVAAGVFTGLALGAASVWLSAVIGRRHRE